MHVDDMVENKISELMKQAEKLEPGSEEHTRLVKSISELLRFRMDTYKAKKEAELREEQLKLEAKRAEAEFNKMEEQLKAEKERFEAEVERNKEQDKAQNKSRWIDIGLRVTEFAITETIFVLLFGKGMKFEETGTWRSPWFRNLWSKIKLPRMK